MNPEAMPALRPDPQLLREVRERIARNPPPNALKRSLRSQLNRLPSLFGNPFVLIVAMAAPPLISAMDPGPRHFAWSVLLFLGTSQVAGILNSQLREHVHLVPFAFLPVPPDSVLRTLAVGAIRRVVTLSIAGGIGFGIASFRLTDGANPFLSVIAGVGMAAGFALGATAYSLAAQRSSWLATPLALSLPITVLLMISLKSSTWMKTQVTQLLSTHGDLLSALLPSGWVVLPWTALTGHGPWQYLAALIPLGFLAASIPLNLRWTRDTYVFREHILLNLLLETPEGADEELAESVAIAQQRPPSRGETAILDDIADRHFLTSNLSSPEGRIESLVWRWWTPRERIVAEYLRLHWPNWSDRCRLGAIVFAGTIPISVLLGLFLPDWIAVSFIGFGAGALYVLPVSASFTLRPAVLAESQLQLCPIHALPVSLAEVARVQWKATTVRSLIALPLCAATAGLAIGFQGGGYLHGAVIGSQAALIWIAIRPGVTVYRFQAIQRGWMKGFISKLALAFVVLVLILDLVGLFACAFPFAGLAAVAALLPLNYLALRFTCRLLDRHGVDAIMPIQPG
jgi:hypothetical protein